MSHHYILTPLLNLSFFILLHNIDHCPEKNDFLIAILSSFLLLERQEEKKMIIFSSVSLDLYGNYDRLCVKLHANGRKFLILMANSTHSLQQLQYQEILWCFMMQQQERLLLGATVHLIVHNSRALIIKSHKLCVLPYYTTAAFCCSCVTLFGSIAVGLCNCSSSSWIEYMYL